MDSHSPYSDFVALAARIGERDAWRVVSAATFVYAWKMKSSGEELSDVPGRFVYFEFPAKQAMASAAAWAGEQQRSGRAGDIMLAILMQADPVAMETLVRFDYDPANLSKDLLSQLGYPPGSIPTLVSVPGAEMVSSLPKGLRDSVEYKLSEVMTEAAAGAEWQSIWVGCKQWVDEISGDQRLDSISQCSVRRYLLVQSQAIIKEIDPNFVLWSDLRRAGGYWQKRGSA